MDVIVWLGRGPGVPRLEVQSQDALLGLKKEKISKKRK